MTGVGVCPVLTLFGQWDRPILYLSSPSAHSCHKHLVFFDKKSYSLASCQLLNKASLFGQKFSATHIPSCLHCSSVCWLHDSPAQRMLTACFTNATPALPTAIASAAPASCPPCERGAELLSLEDPPCPEYYPGHGVLETRITAGSPGGATDPLKAEEVGRIP